MGQEKIKIYKALDHLFCQPDNPVYEVVIKDGEVVGYKMKNMIKLCRQFQHIPCTPNPNTDREYTLLAFGLYPVYKFLLEPAGCISNICYSETNKP